MAQIWLYCSTKFPFQWFVRLKKSFIKCMERKRGRKHSGIIFDWYVQEDCNRTGLYHLYRRAYQGKVDGIMIYSLKDVGSLDEQVEFLERMQELDIPVFCLKENRYLKVEAG